MFTLSVKNLSFTIDTIWITRDGISNEKIVLESGASYNDREYWFNEKISDIDLNLVKRVLDHLNYEDLEKRVSYAAYDMPK